MSGAKHAIVGEQDSPMELPTTQVSDEDLNEERKLAKYSKSAEFKRLKKFLEDRIEYHQKFLPGGQPVKDVALPAEELVIQYKAACIVIFEIKNILSQYDRAAEVVSDAQR